MASNGTEGTQPTQQTVRPVFAEDFPEEKRNYAKTVGWVFRGVLAAALVIGPAVYIGFYPKEFGPLPDFLISVLLFLLAYWTGSVREQEQAALRANDRWLPQAESVILRLMTLRSNVVRFAAITRNGCKSAECDLPQLNDPAMEAVRISIRKDCQSSGERLDDIANQLEDAIEDWRRFIMANCQGDECYRIARAIEQRSERLLNEGIDDRMQA